MLVSFEAFVSEALPIPEGASVGNGVDDDLYLV
jgi:hypothetical protein